MSEPTIDRATFDALVRTLEDNGPTMVRRTH